MNNNPHNKGDPNLQALEAIGKLILGVKETLERAKELQARNRRGQEPKGAGLRAQSQSSRPANEVAPNEKTLSKNTSKETAAPAKPALRPTRFTSRYYFEQAKRIWHYLVLSLALDAILLLPDYAELHDPRLSDALLITIYLTLILLAPFLYRSYLIDLLLKLDKQQQSFNDLISRRSKLAVAAIALATFLELVYKLGGFSLIPVLLAGVVTLVAVRSIKQSIKTQQAARSQKASDKTTWIEQTNRQVFWIMLTPCLLARALSTIGLLFALSLGYPFETALLYPLAALGLLLISQPQESFFIITCKSCGQKTSIIQKFSGLCPICEQRSKP